MYLFICILYIYNKLGHLLSYIFTSSYVLDEVFNNIYFIYFIFWVAIINWKMFFCFCVYLFIYLFIQLLSFEYLPEIGHLSIGRRQFFSFCMLIVLIKLALGWNYIYLKIGFWLFLRFHIYLHSYFLQNKINFFFIIFIFFFLSIA